MLMVAGAAKASLAQSSDLAQEIRQGDRQVRGCELRGGTCRHGPAVCVCMGLGESPAESESESVAACLTSTDLRARETQTLRHGMECGMAGHIMEWHV